MKKLIKNAKILNDNNELKDVHILIDDGKIKKILNFNEDLSAFSNVLATDVNGCLLLSGFINSRSSLLKKFFYSLKDFNNYEAFLEEFEIFKNSLTNEEKYLIYKFEIENAIKNGITTLLDEDMFSLPFKKAVKETGINCVYKLGLNSCIENFDEKQINNLLNSNENFIFALNNVLFNSEDNFESFIKLSKVHKKPLLCNGSFNIEIEGSIDSEFGLTNIKMLNSIGFFETDNILFSPNVLDKEDFKILNENNSKLIFSPSFNLNFGFEIANIYALNKNNKIGLASFENDFFKEMYLLKNLEKNHYNQMNLFSSLNCFNMCTKQNAKILSLKNTGEIKEGNNVDFVMYNLDKNLQNESLIFSLNPSKISSVYILGNEYNTNNLLNNELIEKIKNIVNKKNL